MQPNELPDKVLVAIKLLYDAEKRGVLDEFPEIKSARELMIPISVYLHQDIMSAMAVPTVKEKPVIESKLDIMSQAVQQGYTGEFCDQCFGVRMIKTGTCSTCQECGVTTGCS